MLGENVRKIEKLYKNKINRRILKRKCIIVNKKLSKLRYVIE